MAAVSDQRSRFPERPRFGVTSPPANLKRLKNIWTTALLIMITGVISSSEAGWKQPSVAGQAREKRLPAMGRSWQPMDRWQARGMKTQPVSKPDPKLKAMIPLLEGRLSNWIRAWRRGVPGFRLDRFVKQREEPIRPDFTRPYDPTGRGETLRRQLYVYSPDKTKFLDPHLGMELYEEDGRLKAGFDPESGVALVDLTNKQYKRLLYCGPSGRYDEVVWIDNDTFVVTGASVHFSTKRQGPPSGRYSWVATLRIYQLTPNKVTFYQGPEVGEEAYRIIKDDLLRNFRKKFPRIALE